MKPLHIEGPRASARAASVAMAVMAIAASAHAQHLVPLPDEAISGVFDTSWSSPSAIERGSLVVFARELGPNRARAIRVPATAGVADEPGLDVADVASCGSGRWSVTARTAPSGGTRYELVSPVGRVAWSRAFPPLSLPWVAVECAGATTLFGWVDDGELVIAEASADALGVERRTRVAPTASQTITTWIASSPAELFVAVHVIPTGSSELVRIAGAAITHRRSLGRATDVRLALAPGQLLAAFHGARGETIATSFARTDLAPGPVAAIPPREPGRHPSITSLWPGTSGVVVLAIHESWEGPELVAIPQAGPDRREPAYHTAGYLQTWTPATARLGTLADFGAETIGPGAWLGSTLVVVEPLRRDRSDANSLRFYPARVRRFELRIP